MGILLEVTNIKAFGLDVVAQQVAGACYQYIVPLATFIAMASSVIQAFFSSSDIRVDFTPIFRAFLLMALIAGYTEIAPLLHTALDGFSQTLDNSTKVNDLMLTMQKAGNENKSFWDNFSITKILMDFIVEVGMSYVRYIILALRDVIVSFLYAVGPVAMALSIIPSPMFKNLASKWVQTFIHVHFWYLTLAILDLLFKVYLQSYGAINIPASGAATTTMAMTDLTGSGGLNTYLLTNIVVIISYILTPYLTSLYLGSSNAGAFMSKVVGVAMAATGVGMKMAGGAAAKGGAQGAAGAAGSAGNAGGNGASASAGSSSAKSPVSGFAAGMGQNNRPVQ